MRIVIFGGTADSRTLSRLFAERGIEVLLSIPAEDGQAAEDMEDMAGITVLSGRRNRRETEAMLRGAFLCVDATHPYAADVTRFIRAACEASAVPYRRLHRRLPRRGKAESAAANSAALPAVEGLSGKITVS